MISNRQVSVFDTPFLSAVVATTAMETPIDATRTYSPILVGTLMPSGTYTGSQLLALTSAQGATIRYTTNGSTPNASSLVYTEPLVVSTDSTIKAVALSGNTSSSVATRTYAINPNVLLPYSKSNVAARGWQLARFAPQTNDFTYSVDVVPGADFGFGPDGIEQGSIAPTDDTWTDAVIGLAWQQDVVSSWLSINANAYRNVFCRIRFFILGQGRIEAFYGNGTGTGNYHTHASTPNLVGPANPDIRYFTTSTYTIVFSVQYAAKTFGVTVSVDGGAAQVLAVGYPWTASPPFTGYSGSYIPTFQSFNTLAMYSYVGGMQVRNNRLLTGVGVSPLLPQTMGWQASVLAQSAPDTIVSTEGTLVIAKRFGDSNSVTVNGVTFAGHTLSNGIGTAVANYNAFATPGSASAALQDLYDSVVYDTSATHSITGLTVGTTYMLQWFFAEERASYVSRTQSVAIAGYTIDFPAPLTAKATKCYFVATAASHDITMGMNSGVLPQIMAFQVRQISGIGVSASLSASPASMSLGNSTTLAWSTGNAMAASISQGVLSFNGDDLYTVSPGNRLSNYNLYLPRVSSSVSPTGIFAAVPAATPATFATANLYIASTTTINNFIQFASAGTTYSFNLTKSEVIYQDVDNVDEMTLRWTGSISTTGGTALPSTPAICIIEGGGNGSWRATLTAGPVGPFSIAALLVGGRVMSSSTTTVPVAGGSIAVAPSSTTTYSILAVSADGVSSTTASATVTVTAAVAAVIGTQPSAQTIFSGTTSTLTVSATASAPLSYQWYQGTSGTTTTSVGTGAASFTTPSLTSTTSYWVRVTSNGVSVDSATAVVTVVAAWAYTAWTNDADSGITSASTYTTAVNLGGSAVTVNNVQFAATATSGTGYSIGGNILTLSSGASAVTGNSATLANNFIYGGNPQRTVTLTNLTPGSMYETSLFSYGWEASGRVQTFASGSNTLTLDQDVYGNTNGIRIVYTFVADNTGTKVLTITPAASNTFHLSALANRLLV